MGQQNDIMYGGVYDVSFPVRNNADNDSPRDGEYQVGISCGADPNDCGVWDLCYAIGFADLSVKLSLTFLSFF